MDQEFHYWITGVIAKRAGFPEETAKTIAYAAQYVDDNDMRRTITDPGKGPDYEAYISQTMNIFKPKRELMRIYSIFHFLPGKPDADSARRGDGKMHILTTTPDSDLARAVLNAALDTRDPHRIGVAAHTYADSWAHQNFVGWPESINGQALNPLPNIGHADFVHHPDWVGHAWQDERILASDVNNNHRFLSAAKRLFEAFCTATGGPARNGWNGLESDLRQAMGPVATGNKLKGEDARLRAYHDLFPGLPEYDEHAWFKDAVHTRVRGLPDDTPGLTLFKDSYTWKPGWQDSNWFRFQEAVKAHQAFCMVQLTPIFEQMGVDLHAH